jgi:hypothetical protein
MQRPAELGHAVAIGRADLVDPERGVLVGIECNRLAIGLQVLARRLEVVEGRLGWHELQVQEPARGVVDVDEQRALRPTTLKPPMLGAVDLDELAHAVPTMARLMHGLETLLAVLPEPFGQHPLAHRLAGQADSVALSELLGGERRAKVGIATANDRQCLGP